MLCPLAAGVTEPAVLNGKWDLSGCWYAKGMHFSGSQNCAIELGHYFAVPGSSCSVCSGCCATVPCCQVDLC